MGRAVRVSLANKCQLLFGAAVLLILTAALTVAYVRMERLVHEGHEETARELANAWLADMIRLGGALSTPDYPYQDEKNELGLRISLVEEEDFQFAAMDDPFVAAAIERFQSRPDSVDTFQAARDASGRPFYRYARAIRKSDMSAIRGNAATGLSPAVDITAIIDPVEMVLLIQLRGDEAQKQLVRNGIYIVGAGLLALLLAIGVFWFITTRLILSPVRVLRDTAEKIAEGDLNTRSDINTGDEFEQLSDMFNHMLVTLKSNQDQLRSINKSLDLKLGELAESNVALYEANKIKSEFLANVSHELRTPLNSIIGFAEVMQDTLGSDGKPVDEKRRRYALNIITSSKRLLDLINDLLDLAKIEAGRMELHVSPVNLADTAEGLLTLIRPQAEKAGLELRLKLDPRLPLVLTDAGKLHQIVFNFLSNAVKFTPDGGMVTLSVAMETGNGDAARDGAARSLVRISVIDTGMGIAIDDQQRIFEKFTQLDPSVTRQHGGTGLGLTISLELARMLQGRIELVSDAGKGATFSLVIPTVLEPQSAPLMPDQVDTRRAPGPRATV